MALEFVLNEIKGNKKIYISSHDTEGDKSIFVTVMDEDFNSQHDFDSIDLETLLELGTMINLKIGFDAFDLHNIKRELEKEKAFNVDKNK